MSRLTAKQYVANHKDIIAELMSQGKPLQDIAYEINYPAKDIATFRLYVYDLGLKYTHEQCAKVKQTATDRRTAKLRSRTPEEKRETYLKYAKTLNEMDLKVKQEYIKRREATKRRYTEAQKQQRLTRMIATKTLNKSFSSSKPEERLYKRLIEEFSFDDIIRQYKDARYPYACDFYIKSEDLFIELNGYYTHGSHPYSENSDLDKEEVKRLKSKPQSRIASNGRQVRSSAANKLYTWTLKDPEKIQKAECSKLKYIAIYLETILNLNIDSNYKFLERIEELW